MIGIFLLVLGLNTTNLIQTVVVTGRSSRCTMTTEISITTNLIALLMRIYLPYLFMCMLNFIVIARLKASKTRVGPTMITNAKGQRVARKTGQLSRKEYKFTVATLSMDFVFLVMHIPVCAWLTMSTVDIFTDAFSIDPIVVAIYSLYSNVAQLIAFSYSLSMIILFIIFNRNFRGEIIGLFRLRKFFQQETSNMGATRTNNLNSVV